MRNRKFLPALLFLLIAPAVAGVSFSVMDNSDWDDGSFTDTESKNDALQVSSGNSGTYTSEVFDGGDNYTWSEAKVLSELNGGSATITVENSRDDFSKVLQRETFSLSGGSESFNLSGLNETRYVRFNYSVSGNAKVNSTNITIGDSQSFIIRNESCQSDEQELFSMSNRTNAHAADPGYWGRGVCASGFEERHYTTVCTSADTPVLSFYGSQQNYTHLSTDTSLFNYKLCTGVLTIGVRNTCPDSTKAIVSLYQESEDHIAEPGHYSTQLCGAFFESTTAVLRFRLGGDETVHINTTENPSQGLRQDTDGRESWYITTQNESMVAGIVSGEDSLSTGVGYDERSGEKVFNLSQERGKSSYLLPFATGDAGDVQDRISLIEAGDFLSQINPNFGFDLAEELTVRVTLQLSEIDLVGSFDLSPGSHQVVIEKLGETSGGVPKVSVNVTR